MILAMAPVLRAGCLVVGVVIVVSVIGSAARTVVLPQGRTPRIARTTFAVSNWLGRFLGSAVRAPMRRHRLMSGVPAFALLSMPVTWLTGALVGFTFVFRALGANTWRQAYETAGSSLFTLGFTNLTGFWALSTEFLAAAISISILALLVVTYLPTMYSVYSSREAITTAFETAAGVPPEAAEMLSRLHRIAGLERLDDVCSDWQEWFNTSRETHTAIPIVVLFRSAEADRSWVVTVAAVLDTMALRISAIDEPHDATVPLCIRSGYLCLRDICRAHRIAFDPDPAPDSPIAITKADFYVSYDKLSDAGLPMNPREQAWKDFAGWRVNYDSLIDSLCTFTSTDPPTLSKRAD